MLTAFKIAALAGVVQSTETYVKHPHTYQVAKTRGINKNRKMMYYKNPEDPSMSRIMFEKLGTIGDDASCWSNPVSIEEVVLKIKNDPKSKRDYLVLNICTKDQGWGITGVENRLMRLGKISRTLAFSSCTLDLGKYRHELDFAKQLLFEHCGKCPKSTSAGDHNSDAFHHHRYYQFLQSAWAKAESESADRPDAHASDYKRAFILRMKGLLECPSNMLKKRLELNNVQIKALNALDLGEDQLAKQKDFWQLRPTDSMAKLQDEIAGAGGVPGHSDRAGSTQGGLHEPSAPAQEDSLVVTNLQEGDTLCVTSTHGIHVCVNTIIRKDGKVEALARPGWVPMVSDDKLNIRKIKTGPAVQLKRPTSKSNSSPDRPKDDGEQKPAIEDFRDTLKTAKKKPTPKAEEVTKYQIVPLKGCNVREKKSPKSALVDHVRGKAIVHVVQVKGRRARIVFPYKGWISLTSPNGKPVAEEITEAEPTDH